MDFSRYNFDYSWPRTYGHLIAAIVFGGFAAVAYWLNWTRMTPSRRARQGRRHAREAVTTLVAGLDVVEAGTQPASLYFLTQKASPSRYGSAKTYTAPPSGTSGY